ncbi:CopG family transcriptional regulator [Thermodesulfobacteriota bacterium]
MRVTVHIPDNLGPLLKQAARDEGTSVSAMTAKALEFYLRRKRKQQAGRRLLELISPDAVAPDALTELEKGRVDGRT